MPSHLVRAIASFVVVLSACGGPVAPGPAAGPAGSIAGDEAHLSTIAPAASAPSSPLRVVLSASSALRLCVQVSSERATCLEGAGQPATELVTTGPICRVAPWPSWLDGAELVARTHPDEDPGRDPLPFAPVELAPLTLGVSCVRSASGEVACDSWEDDAFIALNIDGAPLLATELVTTSGTLYAIDAARQLLCVGRDCGRIAREREDRAAGVEWQRSDREPEGMGSGTSWPVGSPPPPAILLARDVARVRTDGLSGVCIEEAGQHVVCHQDSWGAPEELDATGALDFGTAANDLCVLRGPAATARLVCTYRGRDGVTTTLDAAVPGASRLHARGTTLCVEASGTLSCTELRGISPAAPLAIVYP